MAAIIDPPQFAELRRAIDVYNGSFIVKCALQVQAYTFVRPGELRHAEWQEINFETAQWNKPIGPICNLYEYQMGFSIKYDLGSPDQFSCIDIVDNK